MTALQRSLLTWYARNGRKHLPWRETRDPYAILVSEFMLQQTQVDRVLPKYQAFLMRFPNFESLAAASTADVIREWRGLGYNTRAVRLKRIAHTVTSQLGGELPRDAGALRVLHGVGPYIASAVRAYAFDCDDAAIDTNVRRVTQRVQPGVAIQTMVPSGRGHDWNSALMDLGASICTARTPKCAICPLRRFCVSAAPGAVPQQPIRKKASLPFKESARYARGRIIDRLRELPAGRRISLRALQRDLAGLRRSAKELQTLVVALEREGLISVQNRQVALRD
ncbi:MAG TPA: hypothetical protein VGR69_00300 [Candidatus Rubrimentiphilum sp.]|nr:hypothetical protein [Candidatus Rubrimentiphilum sp.]